MDRPACMKIREKNNRAIGTNILFLIKLINFYILSDLRYYLFKFKLS